jgi:alanine-alpha-ketoisovalerate/valine-pyruvate aminotransferase
VTKEYTSTITVKFSLNYHEAESKEDYVEKIKAQFKEEYGLNLMDNEITEIEEV